MNPGIYVFTAEPQKMPYAYRYTESGDWLRGVPNEEGSDVDWQPLNNRGKNPATKRDLVLPRLESGEASLIQSDAATLDNIRFGELTVSNTGILAIALNRQGADLVALVEGKPVTFPDWVGISIPEYADNVINTRQELISAIDAAMMTESDVLPDDERESVQSMWEDLRTIPVHTGDTVVRSELERIRSVLALMNIEVPHIQPTNSNLPCSDHVSTLNLQNDAATASSADPTPQYLGMLIRQLPQYERVKSHANSWLKAMLTRFTPEQTAWHIRRAAGIGGSESAVVLRVHESMSPRFTNLHEMIRAKLLLELPRPDTVHTRRGKALEPLARAVYQRLNPHYQDQSLRVHQTMSQPCPAWPWLVGNPDGAYLNQSRRSLVIPDFKVPSTVYDNAPVEFDYDVQLHHYALVLSKRTGGDVLPELELAELDLAKPMCDHVMSVLAKFSPGSAEYDAAITSFADKICATDMPGMRMVISKVPFSPQLADKILEHNDNLWRHQIQEGPIPKSPSMKEMLEVQDDEPKRLLTTLSERFLLNKAAEQRFKDAASSTAAEIDTLVRELADVTTPFKVSASHINISSRDSFSMPKALAYLEEQGEPSRAYSRWVPDADKVIAFLSAGGQTTTAAGNIDSTLSELGEFVPDEVLVKARLQAMRVPPQHFTDYSVSVQVSRANKTRAVLENATEALQGLSAAWFSVLRGETPSLPTPVDTSQNFGPDTLNEYDQEVATNLLDDMFDDRQKQIARLIHNNYKPSMQEGSLYAIKVEGVNVVLQRSVDTLNAMTMVLPASGDAAITMYVIDVEQGRLQNVVRHRVNAEQVEQMKSNFAEGVRNTNALSSSTQSPQLG